VRIARRLGDPKTLAYTLEGTYASISWPRDIDRWLSMASELTQIGEPLRDIEKVFSGHLHAFGALTVRGDVEAAEREFAAMTSVGHELRQPIQLWLIANAEVMRALQAGRIEEAERRVARALSLGSAGRRGVSDNTTFQYVAHLHEWALQRELGRLPDMRASLERFAAEYPLFMFRSMLVSLYSEIGEEALAREELERLAADGFDGLELRTEWFFGASQLADACERLGVATHARTLYKALLPYADCVVITHPEVSLGSAARYLGLLASVIGRQDDAVSHYEKALETNERIGARPWLARSQADLTRTLLARAEPGDADRAGELARAALDTFRALGMEEPAVRLRRALAERAPREFA
jgi:tetratricopeptide (TPR) repeat protein